MSRAWRQQRWVIAPRAEGVADLARRLGTAPLVAQMLINRGLACSDTDAGKAFLEPKLTDLHDPELLPGATAAAKRIAKAVADKEKIVIYGDYDVDGMTAVAILHACLKLCGASADFYVPHRLEEGYGVNTEAIRKIAADGTQLLITVDCGISANEPLAEAAKTGMDVIVTDHHVPGEAMPPAVAIVHPALPGTDYPNKHLAGAGVAFKLAWQVAREVCGNTRVDDPMRNFLLDATCLAALGTIADVVPLVGENRALAVYGLRGLPSSRHPGLQALLASAGLDEGKLDAYHVGFVLAPRLNACGRMGHAQEAVELLTDAAPDRCRQIADELNRKNTERQKVERAITEKAAEMVAQQKMDTPEKRAIVLACDDWHSGVVGIVASRMVGRFHRPAILIAVNGDGTGQGSGRSIPGFHMRDALAACETHLLNFGGHAMAGGLRVEKDSIPAFVEAMLAYAGENISDEQLIPALRIDAEASLGSLDRGTVEHLVRLAPFGEGNPSPVVAVRGCQLLVPPKRMGRNGQTVSLLLGQNNARLRAVGFGMGDLADKLAGVNSVDVAGEPMLNTFNGRTSVEMKLRDVTWT